MKNFKIHFKTTQYKSNLIQIEYYTIQIKNLTIHMDEIRYDNYCNFSMPCVYT